MFLFYAESIPQKWPWDCRFQPLVVEKTAKTSPGSSESLESCPFWSSPKVLGMHPKIYIYIECMHMVHICSCMFMYVHVCSCMFMYVHVCSCMFMYVHVSSSVKAISMFATLKMPAAKEWRRWQPRCDLCWKLRLGSAWDHHRSTGVNSVFFFFFFFFQLLWLVHFFVIFGIYIIFCFLFLYTYLSC